MLVNKSWLQLKEERYQIHELLRQFLSQKLGNELLAEQSGQEEHSNYYLGYLARRMTILNGPEQQQALLDIERELDNIRVAWMVGVQQKRLDALAQSVEPLYEMYAISSRYEEANRTFQQAIAALDTKEDIANPLLQEEVLAMLLVRQADICIHLGQHEEAANYLHEAQSLPLASKDKPWSYKLLGDVALAYGDREAAEENLQAGLAMSREIGDKAVLVICLEAVSGLNTSFGEFTPGQTLALECLATARSLGRPDYIARALGNLAWATNCLGDYGQSEAYWRESLAICQAIDDKRGIARALNFLGWELWSQGGDQLAASRDYHEEAIAILRKLGSRPHLAMALADYGLVTNELGDFETTVQVCSEGIVMAEEVGMPTYVGYNQTCLGVAQAGLGQVEQGIDQMLQALKNHFETEQTPQCLLSFYCLMLLLTRYPSHHSQLKLSENQIFEMVGFVAQHPFNYHPIRDRARLLQASLAETILTETISPRAELTLDSVVSCVLSPAELRIVKPLSIDPEIGFKGELGR
jgi:tetratricopeptide (TPR) repeat protein